MYDVKSMKAEEFINHQEIEDTLAYADLHKDDMPLIRAILDKAREARGFPTAKPPCCWPMKTPRCNRKSPPLPGKLKRSFMATASSCSRRCICPTTA